MIHVIIVASLRYARRGAAFASAPPPADGRLSQRPPPILVGRKISQEESLLCPLLLVCENV